MTSYIALIRQEPGSDYGVDFPDFPGCITAGRTLDEARRMASEALAFHIAGMRDDGTPIPKPNSLDAIMADAENRAAVAILVDVATELARTVRVNVTLPEDLLVAIDRITNNRSRFLADAARHKLRQSG